MATSIKGNNKLPTGFSRKISSPSTGRFFPISKELFFLQNLYSSKTKGSLKYEQKVETLSVFAIVGF